MRNWVYENFKNTIRWFQALPVIFLLILIILAIIFTLSFTLIKDLNNEPCDFLACKYKTTLIPILNVLLIVGFLPVVIAYFLHITSPIILIILFLSSILYWIILSTFISLIYSKIRKIPLKTRNKISNKEKIRLSFQLGVFFISLNLLFGTTLATLYYPKINVNIKFVDYVKVSAFTIAFFAFFINLFKEDIKNPYLGKSIKTLIIISILWIVLGSYLSLVSEISIGEKSLEDKAVSNGVLIGTLQASLTGIFFLFFYYMTFTKFKKE